jgi:phage baseplate assembly protein W
MAGYSPRVPLALDSLNGFALTQTIQEVAKQNLKMLVLTNPGERVMIPAFGVGIRRMLFEQQTPALFGLINERVISQAKTFLPYININNVRVFPNTDSASPNQDFNTVSVIIDYTISQIRLKDSLQLDVSTVQL